MKGKKAFLTFAVSAVAGLIFVAASGGKNPYTMHTVKKGESISLICIDLYGHYAAEVGEIIRHDNPSVKDINIIHVGQKLKLRKPGARVGAKPDKVEVGKTSPNASPLAGQVIEKKVNATQGVVTYVQGSAFLTRKKTASKSALGANTVLYPGDVIETAANGRVEVIINRESVVRLKEATRLTIGAFRDNAGQRGTSEVKFSIGSVWAKVRKFRDDICRFQLELPTALAGVHGTVYQSTVNSDESVDVKVYSGEVQVQQHSSAGGGSPGPSEVPGPHEVSMEQWTHIVRSMQQIHIGNDGSAQEPESFEKNPDDDWERWNEERDERIAHLFAEI
ncbi:MAG: hypothetical protein GF398_13665 [Chitinivibrionales bacterium]|nr:hypothetical protein [Chitinivibrionales bacterium]